MPKILKREFDIEHKNVTETLEYAEEIQDRLNKEQIEKIERFKQLDIYQQDILLLSSMGYSLREIGDKLGVSYNWVRSRLIEIRDLLDGKYE